LAQLQACRIWKSRKWHGRRKCHRSRWYPIRTPHEEGCHCEMWRSQIKIHLINKQEIDNRTILFALYLL
jgi:hypothetical protein